MFGEHEISEQVAMAIVKVGLLFPYSSGSAEEIDKNPAIIIGGHAGN
jgi:hypothetical protein